MGPRSDARRDKLAAALRENLKRRKARTRALGNKKADPSAPRPNPANKSGLT
jgi:hypothetical protein